MIPSLATTVPAPRTSVRRRRRDSPPWCRARASSKSARTRLISRGKRQPSRRACTRLVCRNNEQRYTRAAHFGFIAASIFGDSMACPDDRRPDKLTVYFGEENSETFSIKPVHPSRHSPPPTPPRCATPEIFASPSYTWLNELALHTNCAALDTVIDRTTPDPPPRIGG